MRVFLSIFTLSFVSLLLACNSTGCEASLKWYEDRDALERQYAAAVEDAKVVERSEISRSLVVLTSDNPDLEWRGEKVLVGTFTTRKDAAKWSAESDVVVGDHPIWVTVPSDLKARMSRCVDSLECQMRLLQLLGLPPSAEYDTMLFFYADVDGMSRPSPDSEVCDSVAELEFPDDVAADYRAWFKANADYLYSEGSPYPWTRLGYTYDWHDGGRNEVGPSEFLVWSGCKVEFVGACSAWEWYKGSL